MEKERSQDEEWHSSAVDYLSSGKHPKDFVGHCCELQLDGIVEKTNNNQSKDGTRSIDGNLFPPELSLFTDAPKPDEVIFTRLAK